MQRVKRIDPALKPPTRSIWATFGAALQNRLCKTAMEADARAWRLESSFSFVFVSLSTGPSTTRGLLGEVLRLSRRGTRTYRHRHLSALASAQRTNLVSSSLP